MTVLALARTFLISEPKVILAYYPDKEDLEELAKIRAMDAKVPITVVLDHEENGLREHAIDAGATPIIPKSEYANYLLKFQTASPSPD
jgi:DNA-binding NarL/FixJ family response regulator